QGGGLETKGSGSTQGRRPGAADVSLGVCVLGVCVCEPGRVWSSWSPRELFRSGENRVKRWLTAPPTLTGAQREKLAKTAVHTLDETVRKQHNSDLKHNKQNH
ncbi:hypothetical protein AMECASPLE_004531, partial [Ameca splendens]